MQSACAENSRKDHRRARPDSLRLMLSCLALLACTACAAKRLNTCDKPPPFYLRLEASDRVNPDPRGRSMPTVVQILQLEDSLRVEQASFRGLWSKPEAALEKDLLQVSEFTVAPGQTLERWIPRDPKARYVVAMGLFRQPLGYAWRTVTVLPSVPENLCIEKPPGDHGPPNPLDEQLRFKLQGYQIDLLRAAPQADFPTFEKPDSGALPPLGRKT